VAAPPVEAGSRSAAAVESRHKAIIFDDVSLSFDQKRVLEGISFELSRGETTVLL
jgi:ABC-type multidrug transport system fused ATPase/permease subunit